MLLNTLSSTLDRQGARQDAGPDAKRGAGLDFRQHAGWDAGRSTGHTMRDAADPRCGPWALRQDFGQNLDDAEDTGRRKRLRALPGALCTGLQHNIRRDALAIDLPVHVACSLTPVCRQSSSFQLLDIPKSARHGNR